MVIFVPCFLPSAVCFTRGPALTPSSSFLLTGLLALVGECRPAAGTAPCPSVRFLCARVVGQYLRSISVVGTCLVLHCIELSPIKTRPRKREVRESKGEEDHVPPVVFASPESCHSKSSGAVRVRDRGTTSTGRPGWGQRGGALPRGRWEEPAAAAAERGAGGADSGAGALRQRSRWGTHGTAQQHPRHNLGFGFGAFERWPFVFFSFVLQMGYPREWQDMGSCKGE